MLPKLQGRPKETIARPYGDSPDLALCFEVTSTWKLLENSECDRLDKEKTFPALLHVGIGDAIPYTFDGGIFNSWIGTMEEESAVPNYLAILIIGWCYILSARLVEILGEGACMQYKEPEPEYSAENLSQSSKTHSIDVGEVDEAVIRWWSAILTQRNGWEGIVDQSPDSKFVTPWTVCRTCETSFVIKNKRSPSLTSFDIPLSSERAFEALAEFACLHNLGSQFPIALAVALVLPTHRFHGSTVRFPPPSSASGKSVMIEAIPSSWASLNDQLPYYMTLSCHPELMFSVLCGLFWELEVPCNLVSSWLHPVLNEVLDDTAEYNQEILALIGAIRRPGLSALWIGAIASGLGPSILSRVKRGRPPLDPLAYPWTGYPQSFMDIPGSGPYAFGNPECISRKDVWRLLHLPPTEEDEYSFEYRPDTPWVPCGVSLTKDCVLRVASHLKCPRHEYQYDYLKWELANGAIVQDRGFSRSSLPTMTNDTRCATPGIENLEVFPKKELDQTASRSASRYIFHWLYINGEGRPSEKIYQDGWLNGIWKESAYGADEIDDDSTEKPDGQSEAQIELWLNNIG
ncbi:hypothetical protein N7466_003249 [Penicillium verhagenii]|uniref:uncharacterized protein n=1 Tax=Penicillium verhagenii TaxID=1562060 RepID=UPI0025450BA3|nr:uncharacterized protein N7466_003249 [Penicillium verhagenii]KAJ5936799.1 hypothetical protein N7466_003249 [Penicillium verhagenii]